MVDFLALFSLELTYKRIAAVQDAQDVIGPR